MKKIIATVLAMVMAMALCVTAFAAVKYTAYDKTGKEIAKDVTYETCKARFDKKDGDGEIAHYDVTMNGVTSYYVVAADAKTYDLKLTTSGKAPLYLVQVDTPYYSAKATAFKAVGDGCGQLDVEELDGWVLSTDDTYYTSTKDDVVTYYVADKDGDVNVLVNNKLVSVFEIGKDLDLVAHKWEASKYDKDNNATQYTCKNCKTVATVYPSKDAATAAGMKNVEVVEGTEDIIGFNFTAKGANASTTTDGKGSPKTFDAGVVMYAGMALMSVAGSAVVIGKKKEF